MDKDTLRKFYTENYEKLDESEKIELIQSTINKVAKELGLTRQYDLIVIDKQNVNYGAFYSPTPDPNKGTITFPKHSINNYFSGWIYNALCHELKHAQQDEIKNGFIAENDKRRLAFMQNSQTAMNLKIKGIEYRGEKIPDMILPAQLYVTNATDSRPIFRDRTSEQSYFYILNPSEKEAFTYGYECLAELANQARVDGIEDYGIKKTYERGNDVDIAIQALSRLYPESTNVERDVDAIYGNICASLTGDQTLVRRVSSEELNFACKFCMAQTYAQTYNQEFGDKHAKTYIDPRTKIDAKFHDIEKMESYKTEIAAGEHKAKEDVILEAKRNLRGESKETEFKKYEKERVAAFNSRRGSIGGQLPIIERIMNHKEIKLINAEIRKYDLQNQNYNELTRCLLPEDWKELNENQKKAVLYSMVSQDATSLGLTSKISLTCVHMDNQSYEPSEENISWKKDRANIRINMDASPVDILYTMSYLVKKIEQHEILEGKKPENYQGEKALLTIQKQDPVAVNILRRDVGEQYATEKTVVADMYIRKPPLKNMVMTFTNLRTDEMNALYKLQPAERNAFAFAEQHLNDYNNLQFQYQNETDDYTIRKVAEMSADSTRIHELSFSGFSFNQTPVGQMIDQAFLNIYEEACWQELTTNVNGEINLGLMNVIKRTQWDSYELGQSGLINTPEDILKEQDKSIENITNSMDGNQVVEPTNWEDIFFHSDKTWDLNDPNRTVDLDDPNRTLDLDDPDKTLDLDDPDRTEDLDDPDRTWDPDEFEQYGNVAIEAESEQSL